jgi:ribosome biogenesis ATPase
MMATGSLNEELSARYSAQMSLKNTRDAKENIVTKQQDENSGVPAPKKLRSTPKTDIKIGQPRIRYSDLGGIKGVLRDIHELVERPFRHPEIFQKVGIDLPRGLLLYGPPGCGKTCLAMAIAGELGVTLVQVAAPELVAGMSGESESRIRDLFSQAKKLAPCILFIDEIDAITPKRESASREMERRIVAQLLSSMDDLCNNNRISEEEELPMIFVIGATNRPDSIDPALRRAGRFDRELGLGIPDESSRLNILQVVSKKLTKSPLLDLSAIARRTPGYVGADLKSLVREAANIAINRIFDIKENSPAESTDLLEFSCCVEQTDFELAVKKVQPSAKREGFAVVPGTTWDDIGALHKVRDELRLAVVEPMRHPELFEAMGINSPAGVLLYGPPGCGKTLLAKAVANESHSNFLSVKGPELLNKYLGESERAIRQLFERARASAPCVIFFDELDSICPPRTSEESTSSSRIVNQLLTELDGLEGRKGVYVLAATNRPDMIDPAMTRPGRLDKILYVGLPNHAERLEILNTLSKKSPFDQSVNWDDISSRCNGFSGADLSFLIRESSLCAINSIMRNNTPFELGSLLIRLDHVEEALSKITPSVKLESDYFLINK